MTLIASLAAGLCAAPILAVAWLALTQTSGDYLVHLAQTRLPLYAWTSLKVGVIAALGAGLIGTGLGWIIARMEFPGRSVLSWALVLPLAVPAYVAAYAWLDLSHVAGPLKAWSFGLFPTVRGSWGAGAMFALVLYPYVYLLARNAFSGQSADMFDAARTLGAGPWTAFRRTALPLARPSIAAGMALVVMEALADYGTVSHLGAPTLSIGLMRAWSGAGSLVDAARLALVLVTVSMIVFGLERAQRARARSIQASGKHRPPVRTRMTGLRGWALTGLALLPPVLGLVIPMARMGWRALYELPAPGLVDGTWHSLVLATSAALIAAALGLGAAYALRAGNPFGVLASRAAGLGYAVPGAVAAVGVMVLLSGIQNLIDPAWRQLTGEVFPILLTSTAFALILAYLSRFAAAAISPAETALARVTPSLDGAARTLGASPSKRFWRVHWPLIAPGALSAMLLVFVEVLKELPATMILRPFNFDTLAVIAHNFASDERLGEAALPALLIIVTALLPMIVAARYLSSRDLEG